MSGYVGTSRKAIEDLIDSVQKPGVFVKREKNVKKIRSFMNAPNIIYHFFKCGKKLFSILIVPETDKLSDNADNWTKVELLIVCNGILSEPVCEGDDGYRKAFVLYQLAEKMYEKQHLLKKSRKQVNQLQIKVFCDVFSNSK